MRVRTAAVALLLAVPAAGLLGGTAHAAPYLPPGKPVPATGIITIEGSAPSVAPAAPAAKRPTATRTRGGAGKLQPRR